MADDTPPLIEDNAAERSLVADVRQLVEDSRTLVEAEIAYHKSRAIVAGQAAKGVAGWISLALALVFFALMALALCVGLTTWFAVGLVMLLPILVFLSVTLALVGLSHVRTMAVAAAAGASFKAVPGVWM